MDDPNFHALARVVGVLIMIGGGILFTHAWPILGLISVLLGGFVCCL